MPGCLNRARVRSNTSFSDEEALKAPLLSHPNPPSSPLRVLSSTSPIHPLKGARHHRGMSQLTDTHRSCTSHCVSSYYKLPLSFAGALLLAYVSASKEKEERQGH